MANTGEQYQERKKDEGVAIDEKRFVSFGAIICIPRLLPAHLSSCKQHVSKDGTPSILYTV